MNEWSRGEIIALVSLIVAVVACLAAILVIPDFRRWVGLDNFSVEKDLIISTPKNKEIIHRNWDEHKVIVRSVVGKVIGFKEKEIQRLGLYVEILIETDRWYPQGSAPVEIDGTWSREAHFGGKRHIIKAVLKDKHNDEKKSTQIEVTVV